MYVHHFVQYLVIIILNLKRATVFNVALYHRHFNRI